MAPKSTVSFKLLIDPQSKRVLFPEAGNDFVYFLFYILSLPIAAVIALLKTQAMVGSLANLYTSIENLNDFYLHPNRNKDVLLKPPVSQPYCLPVPLLQLHYFPNHPTIYRCRNNFFVTGDPRVLCPTSEYTMNVAVSYVNPVPSAENQGRENGEGGIVKGEVVYMVMDNLVFSPMSTISCIGLLNKFKVKDVGSLEEKIVDVGVDEGISLLKAFLQSDTILTDVFLKPAPLLPAS